MTPAGVGAQQHISQVTQALPNATDSYKAAIESHFAGGTPEAQAAFVKYVSPGSVADGAYAGTPHFDCNIQKINMNFARDATDPRGVATTFFHEHGHFIDFVSCPGVGFTSLQSSAFGDALRADFDNCVKAIMKANGLTRKTDAYSVISGWLRDPTQNAISDLCGALSRNRAQGRYGHRTRYWSYQGMLEKEAFAHMYAAQYDATRYALMQQYFPTALAEFEKLLGGMI